MEKKIRFFLVMAIATLTALPLQAQQLAKKEHSPQTHVATFTDRHLEIKKSSSAMTQTKVRKQAEAIKAEQSKTGGKTFRGAKAASEQTMPIGTAQATKNMANILAMKEGSKPFKRWDFAKHLPKQKAATSFMLPHNKWMAQSAKAKQRKPVVRKNEIRTTAAKRASRSALQDETAILYDVPDGGMSKHYQREGWAVYDGTYCGEYGMYEFPVEAQSTDIVEMADGTVYIRDILSQTAFNTWVKGVKDDNTLTIPTGHRVFYDEDWEAYYYIAWATYNDDFEFVLDETKTEITFTIDGDQLVLEDSDDEHIIGLFCADEEEDYGYWGIGDYETVFALDEDYVPATETLVTLPDGATPEEWYTEGEREQDWSADEFSGTAQLYIDGNDIYVGGLFEDAEEGWIKGTADDYGTVTFKSYQYLGNGLWALGTRGPAVLDSFRMYYDEDAATLTLIDQIKASSSLYELNNDEQTLLKLTLMQEKPAEPFIFDLPYSNGFNTPEEQKMFTAIDANEDGVTWHTLANEMQLTTSTNGSDDWLVSPKIWLDAGRSYHFSIYIRNTNRTMAEKMEVRAALEQSADALSEGVQVIAPTEFKATQNGSQFINSKTLENEFRVEESGFYYIGFHSMNEGTAQMLSVDNFLLEAAPLTVHYKADFKESQSYMDDDI